MYLASEYYNITPYYIILHRTITLQPCAGAGCTAGYAQAIIIVPHCTGAGMQVRVKLNECAEAAKREREQAKYKVSSIKYQV